MTTQDKLIRKKLILLELSEFLHNVSEACRINGCSRQHFYDVRKAQEENGIEGLKEKSRRKPCLKNRVSPEVEEAVVEMAIKYPAYGQVRASNELKKKGIFGWVSFRVRLLGWKIHSRAGTLMGGGSAARGLS